MDKILGEKRKKVHLLVRDTQNAHKHFIISRLSPLKSVLKLKTKDIFAFVL
mgnify:CR=1 FL=1